MTRDELIEVLAVKLLANGISDDNNEIATEQADALLSRFCPQEHEYHTDLPNDKCMHCGRTRDAKE